MMLAPLPNQIQTINDTVMGRQSTSTVRTCEQGVHFSGEVSMANNGGFASMRGQWPWLQQTDANRPEAIQFMVVGDGKQYQFRLFTTDNHDGSAYVYHFDTRVNETSLFEVGASDFKAAYRGRPVDKPRLNFNHVLEYGLLIADQQIGKFSLVLNEIKLIKR